MKQLPLGSLPRDVQNALEALLQREVHALSPEELGFLRARRDYLTSDQRKFYGLDGAVEAPPAGNGNEPEAPFDREAAKARLKELDVEFYGRAKNKDLKALLEEAEAAAEDEPEEDELTIEEVKAQLKELDVEFDEEDDEELRELLAGAQ